MLERSSKFPLNQRVYRFGEAEVDTRRPGLTLRGVSIDLRQKTFQVLVYLLENHERVVSKEELLEHVWRGAAVTEGTLSQSLADLRRALDDDPRSPRYLKTYPKSGYRLVCGVLEQQPQPPPSPVPPGAIEVTSVDVAIEEEVSVEAPPRSRAGPVLAAIALAIGAAAIGLTLARAGRRPDPHLPQKPGRTPVAVLFFGNRGGAPELDWLREGLADMLIADLSRSSRLTVLSRQQLASILESLGRRRSGELDLATALEVGTRCGASALVTGSFTRIGGRTRVDIELHDAKTGHLMVAETAVAERAEQILTQVDLLAGKLAGRLGAAPGEPRGRLREARTENVDAYRYYSLALEQARAIQVPEAVALLEKAIALDPSFAMAHARIGYVLNQGAETAAKARPHFVRALELQDRLTPVDRLQVQAWDAIARLDWPAAVELHRRLIAELPDESELYAGLGRLLLGEERLTEAEDVYRRGLAVDPENAQLHNGLSALYSDLGRHEEAIEEGERYVALEPREANAHDTLALAYQWAGRYEEALAEYDRALVANPGFDVAVSHRGNCLAELGRYREASDAFRRCLSLASPRRRGHSLDNLARVSLWRGDLVAAEGFARQAAEASPQGLHSAWLLAEARNPAEAARLAERILAGPSLSRGRRFELRQRPHVVGIRALRSGRPEEAIRELSEAVRRRPLRWAIDPFETCLADAYLELGRLPEAAAEYRRILARNPRAPMPLYRLGLVLERQGKAEEAASSLRAFLAVWKDADRDAPELVDARRRLGRG